MNQRRPLYPYFSRFSRIESVVNSSYNSLQASLDKRFSRSFSVLMSYTFSKTLTDLNSVLTNSGGLRIRITYARSGVRPASTAPTLSPLPGFGTFPPAV